MRSHLPSFRADWGMLTVRWWTEHISRDTIHASVLCVHGETTLTMNSFNAGASKAAVWEEGSAEVGRQASCKDDAWS